ncbi:hypothetical protein [Phorcysia thermohydrogeniphila]|uniref:hypothetical protein n=1 Tax=Phorcysia thermohydrogeniphila TaxID=936138 RepID=UPI001402AB17|nr:hypothetical protein [Phorcysia thermohydrogeniphila]
MVKERGGNRNTVAKLTNLRKLVIYLLKKLPVKRDALINLYDDRKRPYRPKQ